MTERVLPRAARERWIEPRQIKVATPKYRLSTVYANHLMVGDIWVGVDEDTGVIEDKESGLVITRVSASDLPTVAVVAGGITWAIPRDELVSVWREWWKREWWK